jgi:hypothetical protein
MDISRINTNPTEGQKISGNYRKGHARVHGLDITIENPAGSYRVGVGSNGKKWRSKLPHHYGYIRGTAGADGDHVDVFLGHHLKAPKVFVIDQHDLGGGDFDEHKCFVGFGSKKQAEEAYCRAFSDGRGRARIGHTATMDVAEFKDWLRNGGGRKPVKRRADGGAVSYDTKLGPADEMAYAAWKRLHAPNDSGEDYDLRGAYLSGEVQAPDGHMTDRYKKPNHPTFSDQSQYATGDARSRAGHWVGDTFVPPAAMRAAGGGVQWPPPFDMTTEVPSFDQTEAVPEKPGMLSAAGYGAASGATFNMADEIAGARAAAPSAVPEMVGPIPAKTLVGAARTGINALRGAETPEYTKARDEYRAGEKAAEEAHPYVHTAGEIAGSIPAMAAMPEAGFARVPQIARGAAKAAQTAAEYGGLSGAGEGEGVAERALKGASGIVSGIIAGPVGNLVGAGVNKGIEKFGAPVVNTVRGWMNPEGEAARRVATALRNDNELIAAGKANGMTPQQWVAARQNGEPVTLADLGSANTQSLLRSAANTSPEARAQLEKVIEDRFLSQSERVADTVRRALPGGENNARKTADQLKAAYDEGRVPLYKRAYQQGDKPIMSPAMERLMSSDTFIGAMKRAISSGKDRDVAEGLGGFNPMVNVTPDGRIVFNKSAQGVPTYPNLQYWDQVKRELDDVATSAYSKGEKGRGDVAKKIAQVLRGELDAHVPSYKSARGVAEQFFGESNALDAGRKLAGKKANPEDVKAALRAMKPDERELFKEGYASDLAERVIGNLKDTVNVTKGQGMFQSPNERKLAAAIFGPGGMAMLQARMHLETIMDGARQAMGNSTTARQLIEAGLAGGVGALGAGVASGWDPVQTAGWAGGLAGARLGSSKWVPEQFKVGAKHMIGKVDAKTAAKVAELLTSNDPRLLRQGYQMAAKSEAIMAGLKAIAKRTALAGQTPVRGPVDQGVRMLTGPVGARADEEQKRP